MHKLNVCLHTSQQKPDLACPFCAAAATDAPDRVARLHERCWADLMTWLVSKVGVAVEDPRFAEIAESCGFNFVAHKDRARCRLSASTRWDVPGHKAGTTLAEAQGADVPADVVGNAVELAQVLLGRVRERQTRANLPAPPLRSGGIHAPEDRGAVVVSTSLKGVFDVDLVDDDSGHGVFVGFVKPRSQDVVPNAIRLALAQRGVGTVN